MEVVGILAVVVGVLVSAVTAMRRDPRFDRREALTHIAWIAAYIAGCMGLAFGLAPLGRRIGPAGATGVAVLVIASGASA